MGGGHGARTGEGGREVGQEVQREGGWEAQREGIGLDQRGWGVHRVQRGREGGLWCNGSG